MATLTPLSKGLIGLAIVGAVASTVWHLGLKDWVSNFLEPQSSSVVTTPSQQAAPSPNAPQAIPPQKQSTEVPTAPAPVPAPVPAANAETPPPAPAASAPVAELKGATSKLSPAENAEAGRKLLAAGNFAQARPHLEAAVQGGDGSAACLLGEMTLKGQGGIPASNEKAAALFQVAQSHNLICFGSGK